MPYLASKVPLDEEVVDGFLALFAKTTPIDNGKTPPPDIEWILKERYSKCLVNITISL